MSAERPGPVVFLGMHRSGTTLAADLARALGLDFGRVTSLMEMQPLVDLNEWLMRRGGGSWEYPRPVLDLLAAPTLRSQAQGEVMQFCDSHLARLAAAPNPWGWKDPRTTFTLPLWEERFPEMRIVAVRRHGFDVALSLRARATREAEAGRSALNHLPLRLRLRNLAPGLERRGAVSTRCHTLRGALAVWREYNEQLDDALAATGHPVHAVRLEDLLANPAAELRRLCEFLGLDEPEARTERALASVALRDASRASDHALVAEVARPEDAELLRRHGYAVGRSEATA